MVPTRLRTAVTRSVIGVVTILFIIGLFVVLAPSLHTAAPAGKVPTDADDTLDEEDGAALDASAPLPHTSSPSDAQAAERARQRLALLLREDGLSSFNPSTMASLDLMAAPIDFALFGGVEDLLAACESCGLLMFDESEFQSAGPGYRAGMGYGLASGAPAGGSSGGAGGGASGGSGGGGGSSFSGGGAAETKGPASLQAPGGGPNNPNTDQPNNPNTDVVVHASVIAPPDGTSDDGGDRGPDNGPNEPVRVPEPSTLLLAGLGLSGLMATRRSAKREV
jgi:hypothetical protein